MHRPLTAALLSSLFSLLSLLFFPPHALEPYWFYLFPRKGGREIIIIIIIIITTTTTKERIPCFFVTLVCVSLKHGTSKPQECIRSP
jgi:hypothetical protein